MTSRPWMPLYVADYMADTAHLGALESGAYLHLIFYYWQTGALPSDNKELARIAKVSSHSWKKLCPLLQKFFCDGWKHKRIDKELLKVNEISEKRRKAVQARRDRQATNVGSSEEQKNTHSHSHSHIDKKKEDLLSETGVSDPPKRRRNDYPEQFEKFWKAYPTDPLMSKLAAFKAWKKLGAEDHERAVASTAAFTAYCQNNPDYRPVHACKFLTERRFDGFVSVNENKPPSGLSPEQRAKWVREQLAKERENATDGGTDRQGATILEGRGLFRAAQ